MSFFKQPKPRRFTHEPIYYDEHRDRVRQIEQRARKELEKESDTKFNPDDIRGVFSEQIHHRQQQRNKLWRGSMIANTGALIVIIVILLLVWIYLSR